jgi:hypothetical protein
LRLLFDHSVPSPLRRFLVRHEVTLARERGWEELVNGQLIAAAEAGGFEVIVTCDKNWAYQQNLTARRIAVVVLPLNAWPHLQPHTAEIAAVIDGAGEGSYRELTLPRPALIRRPPPGRGIE